MSSEWRVRPALSAFIRVNALGFQTITVNIPGWAGRTSPAARSRVVCRTSRLELLGIRFDGWGGGEKPPFSFYAVIKVASNCK